ncbi:histidine kinase [Saccharopolyspora halophila]|uniref:histidine kinase n=1 Tax=Saccharopolyspora halophila TaxID=405551 RepID=A0ABN3FRP8_9PSEU
MPALDDRERLLSWWDGKARSLLFDLLVAVLATSGLIRIIDPPSAWPIGLAVLSGIGLVLRRRFPWIAVLTAIAVLATGQLPVVPALIALYTFARRRGPGRSLWAAWVVTIGSQVAAVMIPQGGWHGFPMLLGIAVNCAVYSTPAMLGLWMHQRGVMVSAARERIERAERERELLAERAVAEERRRIARELHDVIAHRASAMSLQAGALTMHAQDEETAETAELIRDNSAKALTELRGMLRVLRDGPSGANEPDTAPTAGDIGGLVGDAVAAGTPVRLHMPERLPETSSTTGRAAYRVVQEALTNSARHAPHAEVRVDVEATGEELVITAANGPGSAPGEAGAGYGLLGMRERVSLAGGSLEAGPAGDGFRVRAVLPLRSG